RENVTEPQAQAGQSANCNRTDDVSAKRGTCETVTEPEAGQSANCNRTDSDLLLQTPERGTYRSVTEPQSGQFGSCNRIPQLHTTGRTHRSRSRETSEQHAKDPKSHDFGYKQFNQAGQVENCNRTDSDALQQTPERANSKVVTEAQAGKLGKCNRTI